MPTPPTLLSETEISNRITALAGEISKDYSEAEELVLIGVLKGSSSFWPTWRGAPRFRIASSS